MALNLRPPKKQIYQGVDPLASLSNPVENFLSGFEQNKIDMQNKIQEMSSINNWPAPVFKIPQLDMGTNIDRLKGIWDVATGPWMEIGKPIVAESPVVDNTQWFTYKALSKLENAPQALESFSNTVQPVLSETSRMFENQAPGLEQAKQRGEYLTKDQVKWFMDQNKDLSQEDLLNSVWELIDQGYIFEWFNDKNTENPWFNTPWAKFIGSMAWWAAKALEMFAWLPKAEAQLMRGTQNIEDWNIGLWVSQVIGWTTSWGMSLLTGAFPVISSVLTSSAAAPLVDPTLWNVWKAANYVMKESLNASWLDPNSEEYKNYEEAWTTALSLVATLWLLKWGIKGYKWVFWENISYQWGTVWDFLKSTKSNINDFNKAVAQAFPNRLWNKITPETPLSDIFTPEQFNFLKQKGKEAWMPLRKEGLIPDATQSKIGEGIKQGVESFVEWVGTVAWNISEWVKKIPGMFWKKTEGVKQQAVDFFDKTVVWADKSKKAWYQSNPYTREYWDQVVEDIKSPEWINDIKQITTNMQEGLFENLQESISAKEEALSEGGQAYQTIRQLPTQIPVVWIISNLNKSILSNGLWFDPDGNIIRTPWIEAWEINQADIAKLNTLYQDLIATAQRQWWNLTVSQLLDARKTASSMAKYDATTTTKWQWVIRSFRGWIDSVAKETVPGLKEIDAMYVDRLWDFQEAVKDLVYKQGSDKWEYRGNVVNILKNINNPARSKLKARLDEIMPDLSQRIEAINQIPSLYNAFTAQNIKGRYIWGTSWATAWWLAWFGAGGPLWAIIWFIAGWLTGSFAEGTLSSVKSKRISSILSQTSNAWKQRLKIINDKIKKNKELSKEDKDFLDKTIRKIEDIIIKEKYVDPTQKNALLPRPSWKPESAKVSNVNPMKQTPSDKSLTEKQWDRPWTSKQFPEENKPVEPKKNVDRRIIEESKKGTEWAKISTTQPKKPVLKLLPPPVKKAEKYRVAEDLNNTKLTTKILKGLWNRESVSKEFIMNMTRSAEIKQVERDIIQELLKSEWDRVNVADFKKKVQAELLPLKVKESYSYKPATEPNGSMPLVKEWEFMPIYENISLPKESRWKVKSYTENIYESPIQTNASFKHFAKKTYNYFWHTRIEDMADGSTRRVIEVQSDLYQNPEEIKGSLENQVQGEWRRFVKSGKMPIFKKGEEITIFDDWNINWDREEGQRATVVISKLDKDDTSRILVEDKGAEGNKEGHLKFRWIDSFMIDNEIIQEKITEIRKDLPRTMLGQYDNPTAHFRMAREEVSKAVEDGKTKLQFPTGETAMKIEGLWDGNANWYIWDNNSTKLSPDNLKTWDTVFQQSSNPWIITDVLWEGRFKAVPKKYLQDYTSQHGLIYDKILKEIREMNDWRGSSAIETFDISWKVDQNNPIFKFYESTLWKYLKNKYEAEKIVDEQWVSWYQIDLKPEMWGEVEAFRKGKAGSLKMSDSQKTELKDLNKQFFWDENIEIVEKIASNEKALWSYKDWMIKIVEGQGDPLDTFHHEAVHKYLDTFATKEEAAAILEEWRKKYEDDDYVSVEEKIAEDFIRYAKDKSSLSGKIKNIFDKVINRIKDFFKEWDKIKKMYDDILSGKVSKPKGKPIIPKPEKFREKENPIKLYTMGWYEPMNRQLRTWKIDPDYEGTTEAIEAVSSELKKLPAYKGLVYRWVKSIDPSVFSEIKSLKPGAIITEEWFLSASKDSLHSNFTPHFWDKILRHFDPSAYETLKINQSKRPKTSIVYTIKSKTGRDISEYSAIPQEKEILFDKDSYFVINKVNQGEFDLEIEMTEISWNNRFYTWKNSIIAKSNSAYKSPKGQEGYIDNVLIKHPNINVDLFESPENIFINRMESLDQGQGHWRKLMKAILKYANENNKTITLEPLKIWNTTQAQLEAFYKEFWFKEDLSIPWATMRWDPKERILSMKDFEEKSAQLKDKETLDEIYNKYFEAYAPQWVAKVIDWDSVKMMFKEYSPKDPSAVHEPSSELTKAFLKKIVKESRVPTVVFSAWGPWSGKSEGVVKGWMGKRVILYDHMLSNADSFIKKHNIVKDAWKKTIVNAIYTDLSTAKKYNKWRDRSVDEVVLEQEHQNFRNAMVDLINTPEFKNGEIEIRITHHIQGENVSIAPDKVVVYITDNRKVK